MAQHVAPGTINEPQVIVGSREQLLHLLAEAAEIEHTLMCTYLYAAFSLKRAGEPGVAAEIAEITERWRKRIIGIAIEEMGHLVLVANLTVAVGGRPHFDRPNFPVTDGYFPSDIVVRLAPFSKDTIDHFVFLERPRGVAGSDGEAFREAQYSRNQSYQGIMPGAQDYKTVGHLYQAIRENLRAMDAGIGSEALFIGEKLHQLTGKFVRVSGLEPISDLNSAERAINLIVEQGEGATKNREESHYQTFFAIQQEMAELACDEFTLAWPAAVSPVLRNPPDQRDKIWIDHPATAPLLDLGCAIYGLLLRMIVQCYGRTGIHCVRDQKRLFQSALTLMHALAEVGDALARMPASNSFPGVHAGLSFTMLRGVEPLPPGPAESRVLREQLLLVSEAVDRHGFKFGANLRAAIADFSAVGTAI